MIIANKEFLPGFEFRHPQGGTWKILEVYPEFKTIEIVPTYGTKIKPQIEGRLFKIKGVWFKVTEQSQIYICLTHSDALSK